MTQERRVIAISNIFQQGKTQIPSVVRKALELKDGERIYYIEDISNRIFIEKVPSLLPKSVGRYQTTSQT